ncbi:MAG: hypothetical protein CVV51_11955 [Spirochaetae bacterium HGW-Spirochaetae-7]|jgi:ABC-type phosphate/phosphonate transport system substrate-binding protein|nr:MAG: hypothetical protein CVV51_11955 [Spirochaetae bacterium HGW-Spirochaetae-7]
MGSITIHALDHNLDLRLSEEARRSKKSKNQMVKDLLARSLGMSVECKFADDYREFCGLWSTDDLAAFTTSQTDNSRVDAANWQP